MTQDKKFLVDVGLEGLPFPMKVNAKANTEGQQTIATISISARIMQEFEPQWIDRFIQIVHAHRDRIGTKTLAVNITEYLKRLQASTVVVDFRYPFFIEKLTPVAKEKCLVRYMCTYSAKLTSLDDKPKITFSIDVPAITTYPQSTALKSGGLFGQLSSFHIEVESEKDIFPEDLVTIVDKCALVPVYSFLTDEDQSFVINKIHSESKTSVEAVDAIRTELSHDKNITWYSVKCANFGMLHSYTTVIRTEKSIWVPFSSY